ncbi:hypothetical protein DNTS_014268 [Danionella cerebrum]|uniref:non-specific serine/threonine protein kinase n=1 Tax=Danionella cerebrum TaxID=2873325 RepID=A0A553RLF2_9TELE|nr:hypothetical protein DNTS_014268 [Danionella translucida]TRZ03004.1 hypothetical protein DNTS_014268 [Danionella translucida]
MAETASISSSSAGRRNENRDTEGQTPDPPTSSTQSPPLQNSAGGPRRGTICSFFRRARNAFRRSREPVPAPAPQPEPVPGPSGRQSSVTDVASEAAPETRRGVSRRVRKRICAIFRRARKFFRRSGEPFGLQSSAAGTESASDAVDSDYDCNPESPTSLYDFQRELCEGSFGRVYQGIRLSDSTPPGHPRPLYREVAMMVMLRRPPVCPYVIELYDWFDRDSSMTLVMEYPQWCMTLRQYLDMQIGVPEVKARIAMRQLVQAVRHCFSRGIFYCDINPRNILVGQDLVPEIKLIDFSSARRLNHDGYDSSTYTGVSQYQPPEVYGRLRYHPVPTTVWLMGLTLYVMLKEQLPFRLVKDAFLGNIPGLSAISIAGRDLIRKCLKAKPEDRPTLQEISEFPWMNA